MARFQVTEKEPTVEINGQVRTALDILDESEFADTIEVPQPPIDGVEQRPLVVNEINHLLAQGLIGRMPDEN